jgi:hypothetical protein
VVGGRASAYGGGAFDAGLYGSGGYGAGGYGSRAHGAGFGSEEASGGTGADEDSPWKRGTCVYHDEYGTGVVRKVEGKGRATVLHVQFETGRNATFMPAYTYIETIAGDDI